MIKRERGRKDGRISKPESKTGTRLYIQENSELRGRLEELDAAIRLVCSFSGEWLSSPKIPLLGYSDNFLQKVYFFLHSSKIVDRERSSSTEKLRSESDVLR